MVGQNVQAEGYTGKNECKSDFDFTHSMKK